MTATFGAGMNWLASACSGVEAVAGMTLPGNGSPERGSMTSTHRRLLGFAWQNGGTPREDPGPGAVVGEVPFELRS